ncbi:MAG: DUF6036 family nucleotidyltransferase [Nocardioidaceae bacterium]
MLLDRDGVLRALRALDEELATTGTRADLFVVGGAAMAVAYDARRATVDVDAVFVPTREVRLAAGRVAERLGLDPGWPDDGAKAFVPGDDPDRIQVFEGEFLQVGVASARFLLAMKLLAARVERDQDDIRTLYRLCGFDLAEDGLRLVESTYPEYLIPAAHSVHARGNVPPGREARRRAGLARSAAKCRSQKPAPRLCFQPGCQGTFGNRRDHHWGIAPGI